MSDESIYTFPGERADITWDRRLCLHVGECGRADNDLFHGGRKPWCAPDEVDNATALDVVQRCPTGALAFHPKDDSHAERADDANHVFVANNGPLYLRGDLQIDGAADDMDGTRFRAALCRCGLSANKPFCDNTHEKEGFVDRGAIGMIGPGESGEAGPLRITPSPNGPLVVHGPMTLVASSGRVAWKGRKTALCRCGASKNKPFCDGTHRQIGFTTD